MKILNPLRTAILLSCVSIASTNALANNSPLSEPLWLQQASKNASSTGYSSKLIAGQKMLVNPAMLEILITNDSAQFEIPVTFPDGNESIFLLKQVKVMDEALAAKFPQIRSFIGIDTLNPSNKGRFDLSPAGLSGMFKYQNEWVFLTFDKFNDNQSYVSYFAKDEIIPKGLIDQQQDYLRIPEDLVPTNLDNGNALAKPLAARPNGDSVTTYRLAVSTSAEYTRENGGEAGALAEIARLVNRMNQVLLVDLSIQFELVANNDRLIFTNAETDPFINDSSEDLAANQTTIDNLIGSANYDIGHLLSTDPGGLATLNSICFDGFKARGYSGSSRPFGENFYIQLVIHEFGHQLAADHSFNALGTGSCTSDQRSDDASVEPGSGTTIMSYAGLCSSQDVENTADAYFHSFSVEQIQDHLASLSCGTAASNGNAIPVISTAEIAHTIPANTPFMLTAAVTDADNDELTYIWDQVNPGGIAGATGSAAEIRADNGANPLFRSFPPSSQPTRYFPQLSNVLTNTIDFGEAYPTTARTLNFELLVRDGNGGANTLQASLDVAPTGEVFSVSEPLASVRWLGGQNQSVVWNVAGTDQAPISCANVDILLDADGNQIFESTLLTNTPNDGQQNVLAPSTNASSARLMVKCSDNVFFAVNSGSFEILPGNNPVAPLITDQDARAEAEDSTFNIDFTDLIVDDPDSDYPSNFTLSIQPGASYTATGSTVVPSANFAGTLQVNVVVNDGISDSNIFAFEVTILPVNDAPVAVDDNETVLQGSGTSTFDVLANDSDVDQDQISLAEITYLGSAQVSIVNGQISYTPAASFFGTDTVQYRIEDPSFETDTGTLTIEVTQRDPDPVPLPTPPVTTDSGGGSAGFGLLLLALLGLRSRSISRSAPEVQQC